MLVKLDRRDSRRLFKLQEGLDRLYECRVYGWGDRLPFHNLSGLKVCLRGGLVAKLGQVQGLERQKL